MLFPVLILLPIVLYISIPTWLQGWIRGIIQLLTMLYKVKMHSRNHSGKYWNFTDEFEKRVDLDPSLVQIVCVEDNVQITIGELDALANQIAHWALKIGVKQGDTVSIMLQNRPEMVAMWLGLGKIAAASALINTNATGKALTHAVELAVKDTKNKYLVVDTDLRSAIMADIPVLQAAGVTVLFWDEFSPLLKSFPSTRPSRSHRTNSTEREPFLYIFTSGTTGLPKASKISHSRFYIGTLPFATMAYLKPGSRVYNCLPLYHSAGGMLGMGSCLAHGATVCLRRKFSARAWSADCVKYRCNACQYIGEIARYLVNAPPSEHDKDVRLEYAMGNGMRPDVWTKFQSRYNVKHILEFYAATEGNIGLFNSTDQVGALGFVPRIVDFLYPVKLVKTDEERKDIPYRNPKTGFVEVCGVDEVGLMIGEFDNQRVDRRFDGYTDASATEKKVINNAFRQGDTYFNTGDLLTRDYWGFFYWSDRTGDTYRWKGENVSTAEVENVIAGCPTIADVAVYGVSVPHCDGKAGMAAITIEKTPTGELYPLEEVWKQLSAEILAHLPAYARPLFIRVQKSMALTATFKHQKTGLVQDGFDTEKCGGDSIFMYSPKENTFKILDKATLKLIEDKKISV